jgi:plastocyanin
MQGRVASRRNAVLCIGAIAALAGVAAGCGGSGSSRTTANTAAAANGSTSTQSPATTGAAASGTTTTTGGSGATTVFSIQASAAELAFVPNELSAPAGRIMIRMTNPSQLQHSIALAVTGIPAGPVVGHGGVSEVVANLAPGTYTFYCTVPGHREAGMTGTLTVR